MKEKGDGSLTQQNNDAEQNGNECACAKACRKEQSFSVTRLHISPAVTGTHSDAQCARTTLDGVVIVKYYYWQEIGAHFTAAISIPSGYNACCVICTRRTKDTENYI